ncbi:MAG: phosphatidylserine/phosphatidylglycerophosphate/cardiolipin synthase family protein [Pseudomonadota bacterium]
MSLSLNLSNYFLDPGEVRLSRVRLLVNGTEVFPRFLELIHKAQARLALEIYQFAGDGLGYEVRDALIEAARRGVETRLVYDSFGSYPNTLSFFDPLVRAGARVVEYHPIKPWRDRFNLSRRDHRKMLLADGVSIIGGLNIAEEYRRPTEAAGIHDLAVEVNGPAVETAWRLFERTWRSQTKGEAAAFAPFAEFGQAFPGGWTQIIGNNAVLERWRLRRTLLHALAHAEGTIDLINPYFLPAPDVMTYLRRAARRGVRVRVIVPETSDVPAVDLASAITQHRLVRRRVQVLRYGRRLHAKAILVDGLWMSIGSYNFDYQTLFRNLEAVVNTTDPAAVAAMKDVAENDAKLSRSVTRGDWRRLPWLSRFAARILYRLRRFL